LQVFNLKRENFPNPREFNDYLERVETFVTNLAHGIDVDNTENEILRFKSENADLLERNKKKFDEDESWVRDQLEQERLAKQRALERMRTEAASQKPAVGTSARAIINELKDSDLPAEVILDRQRKKLIEAELAEKEETARLKKKKFEAQKQTASFVSLGVSGSPFAYREPELQLNGPPLPEVNTLSQMGYLQHIRAVSLGRLAGGFTAETGCMRALFESRVDLFDL
uniref:MAT1 domain-containing protein n=1 Tax=Ascaris lumbricoides TaxID=6252 RepID=A0A0M3ITX3_ASCLU